MGTNEIVRVSVGGGRCAEVVIRAGVEEGVEQAGHKKEVPGEVRMGPHALRAARVAANGATVFAEMRVSWGSGRENHLGFLRGAQRGRCARGRRLALAISGFGDLAKEKTFGVGWVLLTLGGHFFCPHREPA
jgi:hypothetical protein